MAFSQKEERLSLRIAKTPQGPTLTFRVHRFSLAKHVQQLQKRPINTNSLLSNPPIVVTNNFGDVTAPPQVKLMRITFQNMYPAINVASVKLKDCRRVVLFHLLDSENTDQEGGVKHQRVEVRHYAIKAAPVGINRKVRRLIQTKIPNLHNVQDIADYISGSASAYSNVDAASDSEPEDASAVVELPQNYAGQGNTRQNKSALKLVELGPRLCLELVKVEQGLGEGNVMYHAHISKSAQEVQAVQDKKEREVQLKQQRKSVQEKNVERKRQSQEEKRQGKRQRREEREQSAMDALRNTNKGEDDDDDQDDNVGDDGGDDSSGPSASDASGNDSDSDAEE